ncbi:MAG: hypothetical protein O2821_12485 [Chloroflexi bacterium]|nr:hypothetical protein [Chloroflexota bacterium]
MVTTTPILSLESDSGDVNETISLDLTLSEVPDGFSGFHVEITVSEPTIAEITDVLYNPLYSMHTKAPSIFPTASATLFAADLNTMIQGGETNIVLATVNLNLKLSGQTPIILTLGLFGVQDELGGIMTVDLVDGLVNAN